MERPPPGMERAPESLTQLLLSFSSIPTQDPSLCWSQQEHQEQHGAANLADVAHQEEGPVADWEERENDGSSWFETEQKIQSSPQADPSSWWEEALTASEEESQLHGDTDEEDFCSPPPDVGGFIYPGDKCAESPPSEIQTPATVGKEHECNTPEVLQSDQSAPGQCAWKRRIRHGKIPDQREPQQGRVCALEKAMRSYVERKSGQVVAPEIGREFDSPAEAFAFYNLYSWEIGFGIQYGQSRTNASKSRTVQDIVCGCAGRPKKENTKTVACNCQTLIKLHRTADNGWYIHDFRSEHNHHLSASCGEKLHWPSHRNIDTHTKDIVKHLRSNNIGITKVFCVIASFFGSMANVPFNKRSLKYMCKRMNQETADDDIRKTVELFSELKKNDPMFADSVLVDSDSKIQALMWTNGRSRYQYKMFGDAITYILQFWS